MGMNVYTASKEFKLTKKKRHYSAMEKKDFPFVALLLAWPVAQILVFWVFINIQSIFMAFTDTTGNLSLQSIERLFTYIANGEDHMGMDIMGLLGKSAFIWFIMNVVLWAPNIITSYMLTRHTFGSKVFRIIYHVPGLVGGVVISTIFKELYAADSTMINLLESLGMEFPKKVQINGLLGHESTAFTTLMVQNIIMGLSGGGMILGGTFMRIPQEVLESAELDGCGFFREIFQISIPCAWPTISTMIIFSMTGIFVADLGFYLYSDGTGKFGMASIGFYLYRLRTTISEVGGDQALYLYGYASAFGLFITVITWPIVILSRWLLSKANDDVGF